MDHLNWVGPTLNLVEKGAVQTLWVALVSVLTSIGLGLVLGVLLCLPAGPASAVVRAVLTVYLHLFRGLPLLATLFIVFFVGPSTGVQFASTGAAIVGLTLWGSANVMEVVRGAIRSIPKAQFEASKALGFGWVPTMRMVILPQARTRMIPPIVNLTVDLIQATTLASLIGVVDVLQRSRQAVEFYQLSVGDGHATPIFAGVLLFFFIICYPLTRLAGRLERSGANPQPRTARRPQRAVEVAGA
ncbi:amino acid ABC transporter permease [Nocardia sp. R16R-3T]